MVNLRFNFKMDLVDISTIDFAFANTYADLETNPFLEKSFPEDGEHSQRSIILTLSAEEAELIPEQFYALATVNFKNGEIIKAHAFKNTLKEAALSVALDLEDTEYNINFFIDEIAGGGGNGANINVEANGHLDLSNGVLSTEANKIYKPVFDDNDSLSLNVADYPNVQEGDLIIGEHAGGYPRIWYQDSGIMGNTVTWTELNYNIKSHTGNSAPPTTSGYNDRSNYHVGDIWVNNTNNDKYLLIQSTQYQGSFLLTWFNLTEKSAYNAGNGININGSNISIDLKTGETVLGFDNGALKSNLSNYYTKTEIDQMINVDLKIEIVTDLPVQDIDTHTIYFVPKMTAETNDVYDEYMYISNVWELIGTTQVDLTSYYTSNQTDNLLNGKVDTIETTGTVVVSTLDYSIPIDVENYGSFLVTAASSNQYISTDVYLYDKNDDLIFKKSIHGTGSASGTFVKIDISKAKTIKLKKQTGGSVTLTYKMFNDVVREKIFNPLIDSKQDKITFGKGVNLDAVNSNTISVKIVEDNTSALKFNNTNSLKVDAPSIINTAGQSLASNEDFRHYLLTGLGNSQFQPLINSTNTISADYINDTSSNKKFVTSNDIANWNNIDNIANNLSDVANDVNNAQNTADNAYNLANNKQNALSFGRVFFIDNDNVNIRLDWDALDILPGTNALTINPNIGSNSRFQQAVQNGDNGCISKQAAYKQRIIPQGSDLPTINQEQRCIYYKVKDNPTTHHRFDKYVWIQQNMTDIYQPPVYDWELLEPDLSNYYTKTDVDTELADKQDVINAQNKLNADYIQNGSNYMLIPKPTAADAGKVLKVNASGEPEWVTE